MSLQFSSLNPRRRGYLRLGHAVNPQPRLASRPVPGLTFSMGARSQLPCWLRSQTEVPTPPLGFGGFLAADQFFGKGGNGLCSSDSRNNLNSLRDAEGDLPSLVSLIAFRINWRSVWALIVGLCSINLDNVWLSPSISRSRQVST